MQKCRHRRIFIGEIIPRINRRSKSIGVIKAKSIPGDYRIAHRHHGNLRTGRTYKGIIFDFNGSVIIEIIFQHIQFGKNRQRFPGGSICLVVAVIKNIVLDDRVMNRAGFIPETMIAGDENPRTGTVKFTPGNVQSFQSRSQNTSAVERTADRSRDFKFGLSFQNPAGIALNKSRRQTIFFKCNDGKRFVAGGDSGEFQPGIRLAGVA